MTVGISSANVATVFLNALLRATNWTAATTVYVKLHVGDPGASGANNAAAGSTTRVAITHAAPSAGSSAISGTNPSWTNGGTSETLSHVSYWDASTAGNFLGSAALASSKAWANGDTYTHTTDTWSISPIAA